jgi:radical SAM superfamily enzyme YgiQ (UPF0313 family)
MKILLVNPLQENPAVPGSPKVILNEGGVYPPLGLMHLATFEKSRGKHEVRILDAIAEKMDYPGIEEYIRSEMPDVVGVTMTTLYLGDGFKVVQAVKRVSDKIVTVVGGPHVSLYPKEAAALPGVDYAVCGEGEYAFAELLDSLAAGRRRDDIEGVLTKNNFGMPAKQLTIDNLDSLPVIDHTLVPYEKYYSILSKSNPVTVMMTSRGCPFKCAFCPQAGTKIRRRSPKNVVEEIRRCVELGIKDILFFDELFTLEKKRVEELCSEFIASGLKFRWHIRTRIKDVDDETLNLMKRSGIRLIQFGIEAGTERIQKLMNKNLDLEKTAKVIKAARSHGILTYGNFMIGSPTETVEEIRQTIDYACRIRLDFAVFAITTLLPATGYFNMAFEQKKIKEDFWAKYVNDPTTTIENAYWPDFNKQELEELDREAYRKFYFRPWYFWNYLVRIASLGNVLLPLKSFFVILINFVLKGTPKDGKK